MFEDLAKNIEQEKKIITDLRSIHAGVQLNPEKKQFYLSSAKALLQQLRILNNSVPQLLKAWSPIIKAEEKRKAAKAEKQAKTQAAKIATAKKLIDPTPPNTVRMAYKSPVSKEKQYVTINKQDKKAFLQKLKLSEEHLKGIKNQRRKKA